MLRHSFSFLVFIAHFVFFCFCKLKHVFGQSPQIPDICTYAHCGTVASIIGHLRLFSEHLRPLTDSHVCFRSLLCIFERVRPILNTWVRLTTIPSEFQHSHPSDYPLRTLSAVFMRFRPSSDNWVHFWKKIKMMFSWDASPSKRRKGREKRELYFKPSPILREPLHRKEKRPWRGGRKFWTPLPFRQLQTPFCIY